MEYKMLKTDWSRLGKDIKMQHKGGLAYAGDDDNDDEDGQDTPMANLDGVIVAGEDFFSGTMASANGRGLILGIDLSIVRKLITETSNFSLTDDSRVRTMITLKRLSSRPVPISNPQL